MRTEQQKVECLRKAIRNAREHIEAGDRPRIYSQYIRYALDDLKYLNFFTSEEAVDLSRSEVRHDHVVPHSWVMNRLLALDSLNDASILKVLRKYFFICVISKREDMLLNSAGLRKKMPDGWDPDLGDVFERYRVAGLTPVRRLKD